MTKVTKNVFKRDPDRRRVQCFDVSINSLIDLILGNEDLRLISNIPKDSMVMGVEHNFDTNSFRFRLQSKNFPEIREGDMPPRIQDAVRIITVEQWRKEAANNIKR